MSCNSFQGKRALVTGAGKGLGRAICKKLVECGASVTAVSRTKENLETLKKEVPEIETVCVDLSDWEATKNALEKLQHPFELLVNNAGIAILEPFLEMTEEGLDKTMAVNFKSMVSVSQVVAKNLIANKKGGSIVNISSTACKMAVVDHTAYSASKAAMDMTTKSMALELGKYQIRVNSVNPTIVFTEMGKKNWSDPEKLKPVLSRIPLGRVAEVEDVVNAVVYLLSDQTTFISGITLPIEGGFFTAGCSVPQ